MDIFKLTHPKINVFVDRIVPLIDPGQQTITRLVKSIGQESSLAPKYYPNLKGLLEASNKFKGDMFEIFVELLMKYHAKTFGITDYTINTENDYGVDATGKWVTNYDPAAIQNKLRENPKDILSYGDLTSFIAQAAARFKVDPKNLLVVSTTYQLHYNIEEAIGTKIKHIGIKEISNIVDNVTDFWETLVESAKSSYIQAAERERPPEAWYHQDEALVTVYRFMDSDGQGRGQIILPTGSGKTTVERQSIDISIKNGGLIHVVMAPRIVLVNQILNDCWRYKSLDWEPLLIRSGADERVSFFSNEEMSEVKATTSVREIYESLKKHALENKRPVVLFSTYHSAGRIGEALEKLGVTSDLSIGDEAHNMTGEGFSELLDPAVLPTKKWLFFTATRRLDVTGSGSGMNNTRRFGTVIYTKSPTELIQKGIILPPRLHVVSCIERVDEGELMDAAIVKSAILKHIEKFSPEEFRLIVSCKSVKEAHEIADYLRGIEDFSKFFISAISSNTEKMKDEQESIGAPNVPNMRSHIFAQYSRNRFAVILHYNIVSEGINLPGTTAVLPLRQLSPLLTTQLIGRALRILTEDLLNLKAGTIKPGVSEGWKKPFGWIIIPFNRRHGDIAKEIVRSIRRGDFEPELEYTTDQDTSTGHKTSNDITKLFENEEEMRLVFEEDIIRPIERSLDHYIEMEELAQIRQDQNILEFM